MTQAALPIFREQGSGHFVNLSSVAGRDPAAGAALYAASKCALAGLSEGLAGELAPLGIHVTIVEPGAFRTDFLEPTSIRTSTHRIAAYQDTSGANLDRLGSIAGKQMGDPVKGVRGRSSRPSRRPIPRCTWCSARTPSSAAARTWRGCSTTWNAGNRPPARRPSRRSD